MMNAARRGNGVGRLIQYMGAGPNWSGFDIANAYALSSCRRVFRQLIHLHADFGPNLISSRINLDYSYST
ncbi:hypothetical protein D3OALGB2SA_3429 [Olavius algarvensis associated proteobacterium Delta 3]|nr:hypothetical protein D3OALGB2SA_3429 [Olavius algarvensis associated proteobacterium Delta 3]